MRKLSTEKRAMSLSALVEGTSVNATARLCGASKVAILRLLTDAGTMCGRLHDDLVRGLQERRHSQDGRFWSTTGGRHQHQPR